MKEKWVDSVQVSFSQVSSLGRVRTRWKLLGGCWSSCGRWLYPEIKPNGDGYLVVRLRGRRYLVHVLVLSAFAGLRPVLSGRRAESRHLNDDKLDNRSANLAWGTHKQNAEDAIRNGRIKSGGELPHSRLTDVEASSLRSKYSTGKFLQKDLAAQFGIGRGAVSQIINNKRYKKGPSVSLPDRAVLTDRKKVKRGEQHHIAKLTNASVRRIRRLWLTGRFTKTAMATEYGVSKSLVGLVVAGKIWKSAV